MPKSGIRAELPEVTIVTKIMPIDEPITRGTIIGKVDGPPLSEAEHFFRCAECGGYFDMRDLGAVLDHEDRCRIRFAIRNSSPIRPRKFPLGLS